LKTFGRPDFLMLYYRYFAPLLAGIDTDKAFPDLEIHLLLPGDMPKTGHPNDMRPHFEWPRTIRIPVLILPDVGLELYFRSQVGIFGHELGHYVHFRFLPNEKKDDPLWQKWSKLTGKELDFVMRTHSKLSGREYPHIPSQEDFADEFSFWLQGERLHMEAFCMGLWGQKAKVTSAQVGIFKAIHNFTGASGKEALQKHLSVHNPRALVYL